MSVTLTGLALAALGTIVGNADSIAANLTSNSTVNKALTKGLSNGCQTVIEKGVKKLKK